MTFDDSDPEFRRSHEPSLRVFVEHFFPSGTKVYLVDVYVSRGIGGFSSAFLKEVDSDPTVVPLPGDLREVLTHAANVYEVLGT